MKDKIIKFVYIVFLVTIVLAQYSLAGQNSISKEKFAWGFRRGENHEQPDLDAKPLTILEQYNGMAMGDKESKKIYLTFDAGFEAGYTEKILEILEKTNVKATFFITAHYLNTATDLVKKMVEGGHDVRKSHCKS